MYAYIRIEAWAVVIVPTRIMVMEILLVLLYALGRSISQSISHIEILH